MISHYAAGLLPGLVSGLVAMASIALLISRFQRVEPFDRMGRLHLFMILGLGSLLVATLALGPGAQFVLLWMHGWASDPHATFTAAMLTLGLLLSILAFASRTVLPLEKTILNLIFTIILGVLIPLAG